jgi:2-dehydropantoate 2-reductase
MRFLVAGVGAVGGFLAARLADEGHDVTVLARPHRAADLRKQGLRVTSAAGDRTYWPGVVTAPEVGPGYDVVLLAVKSDALGAVMDDIAPAVTPSTSIVPFLNGISHVERLTARFGAAVLGGVLKVVTQLGDDGRIQVLAPAFELELGELDGAASERVTRLAAAFRDAGAEVTVPADIVGAMWAKWVFIAAIGAVTSLMRAPAGDIVAVPGGERFARSVLAEAAAVATAAGHPVPGGQLQVAAESLTSPGSPATSSLSRDLVAGRPTEVEAVLGDLAARARATGVAVPLTELATLALRVHNRRLAAAATA